MSSAWELWRTLTYQGSGYFRVPGPKGEKRPIVHAPELVGVMLQTRDKEVAELEETVGRLQSLILKPTDDEHDLYRALGESRMEAARLLAEVERSDRICMEVMAERDQARAEAKGWLETAEAESLAAEEARAEAAALQEEVRRLRTKKCPHDLARELLGG